MTADALVVGGAYTRDEIHRQVGGSRRSCLPTRDGIVVAACLLRSFNPQAPDAMLCGTGPQNGAAGATLAAQRVAIPIFVKAATNRWIHAGRFVPVASLTEGARFEAHLAASNRTRASVSRLILFERAPDDR